jgi:homoserine acetyltransferase
VLKLQKACYHIVLQFRNYCSDQVSPQQISHRRSAVLKYLVIQWYASFQRHDPNSYCYSSKVIKIQHLYADFKLTTTPTYKTPIPVPKHHTYLHAPATLHQDTHWIGGCSHLLRELQYTVPALMFTFNSQLSYYMSAQETYTNI